VSKSVFVSASVSVSVSVSTSVVMCEHAMDRCKCSCFCTTLREKARCILQHCIPPASLSYARGHHGLHGARVMLSLRIADPLSGRRAGS